MKFKSAAGSTVTVSGKHQGVFTIDFDWFEEGACCDSYPDFNNDFANPAITACCECHEPMRIDLHREDLAREAP